MKVKHFTLATYQLRKTLMEPTYKEMEAYCGVSSTTFAKYKAGKRLPIASKKIESAFVRHGKRLIGYGKMLVTTYEEVDTNKPLPSLDKLEAKYLEVQDAFRAIETAIHKEAQQVVGTYTEKEIMILAEDSPTVDEAKLNFITVLNEEV